MNTTRAKSKSVNSSFKIIPNLIAGVILFSLSILTLSGVTFETQVSAQNTGQSQAVIGNTGNSLNNSQNTGFSQPSTGSNQTAPKQTSGGLVTLKSPVKRVTIDQLLDLAVRLVMRIGTVLSVLALMYVGFQFVVARGNEGKISAAKEHLWYVIIGIAVLFGATLIVEIIKVTLSPFVDTANLGAKP